MTTEEKYNLLLGRLKKLRAEYGPETAENGPAILKRAIKGGDRSVAFWTLSLRQKNRRNEYMETITSVEQLERGDRIFRIDNVGRVEIIEFLCVHPHHSGYSIFLDMNQDPIKKFWNKDLAEQDWYRYDSDVWTEIYQMEIEWHLKEIEFLKHRKTK